MLQGPIRRDSSIAARSSVPSRISSSLTSLRKRAKEALQPFASAKLCQQCRDVDRETDITIVFDPDVYQAQTPRCPLCTLILYRIPTFRILGEEKANSGPIQITLKKSNEVLANGRNVGYIRRLDRYIDYTSVNSQLTSINFDEIRAELATCKKEHANCSRALVKRYQQKIDLILIDTKLKCLVVSSSAEDYCALSYVWGGMPLLRTTKYNFEGLQKPGALCAIPQVVEDGMNVVRSLGLRYLWVDCLCILQDSNRKHEHIALMDVIYAQAYLTIISVDGQTVNTGLPGINQLSRLALCRYERIGGLDWISEPPQTLSAQLKGSIYETRGWTLQERSLSARLLYFTAQEVILECGVSTWHEHSKTRFELRDLPGSAEIGRRINGLMRNLGYGVLPVDSLPRVTLELGLIPVLRNFRYGVLPVNSLPRLTLELGLVPEIPELGYPNLPAISHQSTIVAAREEEKRQKHKMLPKETDLSKSNDDIQTKPRLLSVQNGEKSRCHERWDLSNQPTAVADDLSAEIQHHRNSASQCTNQHNLDVSRKTHPWKLYSNEVHLFLPIYMDLASIYTSRKLSFATDILAAFAGFSSVFEMFSEKALIRGLPESAFAASLLWAPQGRLFRRQDREGRQIFPSYTWAGWVGSIYYPKVMRSRACMMARVNISFIPSLELASPLLTMSTIGLSCRVFVNSIGQDSKTGYHFQRISLRSAGAPIGIIFGPPDLSTDLDGREYLVIALGSDEELFGELDLRMKHGLGQQSARAPSQRKNMQRCLFVLLLARIGGHNCFNRVAAGKILETAFFTGIRYNEKPHTRTLHFMPANRQASAAPEDHIGWCNSHKSRKQRDCVFIV